MKVVDIDHADLEQEILFDVIDPCIGESLGGLRDIDPDCWDVPDRRVGCARNFQTTICQVLLQPFGQINPCGKIEHLRVIMGGAEGGKA